VLGGVKSNSKLTIAAEGSFPAFVVKQATARVYTPSIHPSKLNIKGVN
jgi:hypothetical protein